MTAKKKMKVGTWTFVVRRVDDGTAFTYPNGLLCHEGKGSSTEEAKRDCIATIAKRSGIPADTFTIPGCGSAEDIAAVEIVDHEEAMAQDAEPPRKTKPGIMTILATSPWLQPSPKVRKTKKKLSKKTKKK
jgi:hypothetical protein